VAGEDPHRHFWAAADRVLGRRGVTTGTMMGFPCLRAQGRFFASSERGSGDLIVKLPEARVKGLIADGEAVPFAPNGRVFREWARVPDRDPERWSELIDDALAFARE
jgi:hypothetical protein